MRGLVAFLAAASATVAWAGPPAGLPPDRHLRPERMDVSPPLRDIVPIPPQKGTWERPEHKMPDWVNTPPEVPKPFSGVHVLQDFSAAMLMPTPLFTFEGVGAGMSGYTVNVAPPDTEGDVGPNHYIQWVNVHFAIFDKNGNLLYGPAAGKTLWQGFGGACESRNDGDPIVQYDQFADRWIMTQFAVPNPFYQCVAVSATSDPLGPWYRYAYSFGNQMNDYPKWGIWVNGTSNSYLATYNMFLNASTWSGGQICAYDRADMLAGNPTADALCWGPYSSYGGILPADVDGPTQAPSGSPAYFLAFGTNSLLFWRLTVNWSTNTGTLTGPTTISVATFTRGCNGGACIPQPGTTNQLDSLGDRLMYRLAYRNFGSYESLVANHTINGSAPTAVRWYELRNLQSNPPTVYQSGTYQPDANSRWMGSAAMDGEGNLAIGFSISSSSMYPSIRYAGRLASDPLGTLGQGETTMFNGSGSQTGTQQRWGDYSSLSVDPVDDCTFWYTTEYLAASGTFNWRTRIGTFRFPQTKPGPSLTATANGNNRVDLSWSSIPGVTRYLVYRATQPGGPYTLLATLGPSTTSYSDPSVQGGVTYYYRIRHNVCTAADSNEASVTALGGCTAPPNFAGVGAVSRVYGNPCQLQLSWNPASSVCGGGVVYAVYRSTSPSFTPSAANRIATNLTTTSFTDSNGLASGTWYYYIVRATDTSNGAEDSNTITKGNAPFGPTTTQTFISENFDSLGEGALPAGWATGYFSGNANDWRGAQACTAKSGSMILRCGGNQCNTNYGPNKHAFTRTSGISFPAGSKNAQLSFWHRWNFQLDNDGGYLRLSFDGTTYYYVYPAMFLAGGYNNGSWWSGNNDSTFINSVVDLDATCNAILGTSDGCAGQTVYVAFVEYTNGTTNLPGWYIDDVVVTADVPVACTSRPNDVQAFTATAKDGQVKLEWVNPTGSFSFTRLCWSTTSYPSDPTACSSFVDKAGSAGAYDSFTHTGLANGTTYYYTAFAATGSSFADGVSVSAKPFPTTGSVKWGYSTGALATTAPSLRLGPIGQGEVLAVANDRFAHGTNPSAAGGDWPRTAPFNWVPLVMNGPVQSRSPLVPTTVVPGASLVAFLASQDGTVYAVNAHTGQLLWRSSVLGEVLQGAPAGTFTAFGAPYNLLFVGTRNATSDNRIVALNPADGTVLWSFDNGGGSNGIGIISGGLFVDAAASRIYFSSRARGSGSNHTLWCLSFTNTGASKVWSVAAGDSDAAPMVYQGRVYFGNNSGEVKVFDANTGALLASYATADGPVKGYVIPDFTALPRKLFFATTTRVWVLEDNGGSLSSLWNTNTIPNPSIPLRRFGSNFLYVGGGDGRLYQVDLGSFATTSVLLPTGTQLGSPTLDTQTGTVYVGTDAGTVYAVALPLS